MTDSAQQRTLALIDATDMTRRAAAAALAANCGESDAMRARILTLACEQLNHVLRQLQALA
jgi:hypothetical protein